MSNFIPSKTSANQRQDNRDNNFQRTGIRLTRFTGPQSAILTKQFSIAPDGTITKRSQPQFSSGLAESIEIEHLAGIETVISALNTNQCISTATFDVPECFIVRDEELTPELFEQGTRSRSKKNMTQPDVGLILLDHDPTAYMPDHIKCDSPTELMGKLKGAVPELVQIGYSGTSSCSSGVYKAETDGKYSENSGLHVYIVGKEIDLDELRRYLEVKLWNAGLGYIAFARNGAMLPRTISDLAVLRPERLIYEAAPILGDGLAKVEREWTHRDGSFLTGPLELSDAEIAGFPQCQDRCRLSWRAFV